MAPVGSQAASVLVVEIVLAREANTLLYKLVHS